MKKTELLENLTDDIITYVMYGEFPEDELAAELKHEGLDERFNDYELLMDLHFILKPEVVDFVKELPHRIRSIKTQTRNESDRSRGSIDGKINWSSTIKERYSGNPGNRSLFVTENRTEHYNIDENIVLKKLLSIIYHTLQNAKDYLKKDYDWVNQRWKENQDLVEELERVFERDVHVKRIRKPEEYEPTYRMLNTAEKSRQTIYREAAELIEERRKIFDGEEEALQKLLQDTAITPDDEETLLELFVLFRFISKIEDIESRDFTLDSIESGSQEVASLESKEKRINVYHDSSTDITDLKFNFNPEKDVEDREYSRPEKVEVEARNTIENYFDKDTAVHTGRPDVILVEIEEKDSENRNFFITEVKNSTNEKTIRKGIKESLEYLAFLREGEEFVYRDDVFGGESSGLLVVQDFEAGRNVQNLEDQEGPIRIVEASKLEENIGELIDKKISTG